LLLGNSDFANLIKLSEKLKNSKFRIPYQYVKYLQETGNLQSFTENSDFKFFKNTMSELDASFSGGKGLSFFEFAAALRVFQQTENSK